MDRIQALVEIIYCNSSFEYSDFGTNGDIRTYMAGNAKMTNDLLTSLKDKIAESAADDEDVVDFVDSCNLEEVKEACFKWLANVVGGEMDDERMMIEEAVSNYFSENINEDGYDSYRSYLEDLDALADGDTDRVFDFCWDFVMDDLGGEDAIVWHTEDEVNEIINAAIIKEAEYRQ